MLTNTAFLNKLFTTGVGQYDPKWDKIEAEWYMATENIAKREFPNGGFELQKISSKSTVYYPNIKGINKSTKISFSVSSKSGGKIKVYSNKNCSTLITTIKVPNTKSFTIYKTISAKIKKQ